jgi:hypothetical protein
MFNLNKNVMKKVMFALCFVLGGTVLVNAQDTTSNQYNKNDQQYQQMQGQQQDRQRIQTSELPDAVKRTLEDQQYRGWLVSGAFTASANQSSTDSTNANSDQNRQGNNNAVGTKDQDIYVVELKNGAETKTVAFHKNGERIEGWQDQNQNGQDNQNGQENQNGQQSQSGQYNQNGQNNQYNQGDSTKSDQMNQNGQSGQNNQYNQSDSTPSDQMNQSGQNSRSYQNGQSTDQNSQSTDQNTQSTDQNSQKDQQTTSPDRSGQSSSSGDRHNDQK